MAEPSTPLDTPVKPGDAAPSPELLVLRHKIDALDGELLALLNRRMQLAIEVGELKKREGSVVFRPEREAQVIDGLKAGNPGPLKNDNIAPIWREIMSACRALETPTRVAYLGPAGTFSEEAALGFFGSSIVKVPCATFDEVECRQEFGRRVPGEQGQQRRAGDSEHRHHGDGECAARQWLGERYPQSSRRGGTGACRARQQR